MSSLFARRRRPKADSTTLFDPFASSVPLCLTYQPGTASTANTSPAASLTVQVSSTPCPGFVDSSRSTLELCYDVPAGTQVACHPHPGVPHEGTNRVAYLPDNVEGRQLLARLKIAFLRGLTFQIGRSLTSGLDHQVCWTEIPHKTSLHGGPFAFPDAGYIPKAHTKLCRLGIPDAYACAAILQQHQQGLAASVLALQPPPASTPPAAAITNPIRSIFSGGSRPFISSETPSLDETLAYTAPKTFAVSFQNILHPIPAIAKGWDGENCAVCLEALRASEQNLEQIGTCLHVLHRDCLEDCLHKHPRCPVCRTPFGGAPQGKGPSGTMTISSSSAPCPGFPRCGTITIQYDMPSGTQTCYHDHPGKHFSGANRVAYLPDNSQGRDLLERLKYAWMHGLTFRVGTSLTTNAPNQTTWASIHHKTSLNGGAHGFPDPNYIGNCNASLDALHVPSIHELRQTARSGSAARLVDIPEGIVPRALAAATAVPLDTNAAPAPSAAFSLPLPAPLPAPFLYTDSAASNVFAGSAPTVAAAPLPPPPSSSSSSSSNNPYGATAPPLPYVTPPVSSGSSSGTDHGNRSMDACAEIL